MRRTSRALLAASAGTALAASALAAPSLAANASYSAEGTVVRVTDGDTFFGRVSEEGPDKVRIRLSGVQAMERGECLAQAAQNRLRQLLPRKSAVTVKARFKSSKVPNRKEQSQDRPLRLAFNSRGQDVQEELLRSGLVLPNLMRRETVNEKLYWQTAQEAAASRVGLWSTTACGVGPAQDAQLRVMVNYNADGNDKENPNGKYARILNSGATAVNIGRWYVRTAKHARFYLPSNTVLQPGGEVLIHQGRGVDGGGHLYWGNVKDSPAPGQEEDLDPGERFTNPDVSRYRVGGLYLVDPQGDLRAWSLYPCMINCVNPLAGKMAIDVIYDPEGNEAVNPNSEVVNLRNTSAERIDFSYLVIEVGNGEVLEFPAGTYADPGETVVVHVGKGSASRLDHYLGRDSSILPNSGGPGARVVVRTHESVRVGCFAWGGTDC